MTVNMSDVSTASLRVDPQQEVALLALVKGWRNDDVGSRREVEPRRNLFQVDKSTLDRAEIVHKELLGKPTQLRIGIREMIDGEACNRIF